MPARIRFRQVDVPWETVHGDSGEVHGFTIPEPPEPDAGKWTPFQVEFRGVPGERERGLLSLIRLAIWERLEESE